MSKKQYGICDNVHSHDFNQRSLVLNVVIFFVLFLFCGIAQAANVYWDGECGDYYWNSNCTIGIMHCNNWTIDCQFGSNPDLPHLSDDVDISSNYVIISGGNAQCKTFHNSSSGYLVLQSGVFEVANYAYFSGRLQWSAGNILGYGSTEFDMDNQVDIYGSNNKYFSNCIFNNYDETTVDGTGNIYAYGSTEINNTADAYFYIQSGLDFLGDTTAAFNNHGMVIKTSGTTVIGFPFTNYDVVRILSGTLNITSTYLQNNGETFLQGGNLQSSNTLVFQGGSLTGTYSVIGNVSMSGTVSPGNSAGALTIQGNYTQSSSGTSYIEIGGLSAGTEYDVLSVSGTAQLGGTLTVDLIDGYWPEQYDSFTILTANSVQGQFSTYNLPYPSNITWQVYYYSGSVVLEATAVSSVPTLNQFSILMLMFILGATLVKRSNILISNDRK